MACIIRRMEYAEMEIATYLAHQEGWNPGLADGWAFYKADPNGFFIAEIDNKVVGCISAVKYSTEYGFIGFYVVELEHRKSTAGTQLALAALSYLDGCNIGIDGVPGRIANYERLGFKVAHFNARFENVGADYRVDKNIVFVNTVNRKLLYDYDRKCFPASRQEFIDAWINMPNTKSYICFEENTVRGWGLIRKCRNGYKIGPLFADNYVIADSLYKALARNAIDELIYLDDPIALAVSIMNSPVIKMHGSEHHFIVPAVLLTCINNSKDKPDDLKPMLDKAALRADNESTTTCTYHAGTCGAAIGTGIFISMFLGRDHLQDDAWSLSNHVVADTMKKIAEHGGPRCCKRDTYFALETAVEYLNDSFALTLKKSEAKCTFSLRNRSCGLEQCIFYNMSNSLV